MSNNNPLLDYAAQNNIQPGQQGANQTSQSNQAQYNQSQGNNNNNPAIQNNPLLDYANQNNIQPSQQQQGQNQQPQTNSLPVNTPQQQQISDVHSTAQGIWQDTLAGIAGFNNEVGKLPLGVMQLMANTGNWITGQQPGAISNAINKTINVNQQQADQAANTNPYSEGLGAILGAGAQGAYGAALGGGIAGAAGADTALASPAMNNALLGATQLGLQATQPGDSRLGNAVVGAIGGAVMPAVTGVLGQGINKLSSGGSKVLDYLKQIAYPEETNAINSLAGGLDKAGVNPQTLQAGLQLGQDTNTNIAIPEMLGGDLRKGLSKAAGAIGPDEVGAANVHINNNIQSLTPQVNAMINGITPEGDPQQVADQLKGMYGQLKEVNVNDNDMAALKANPLISKYIDQANNSIAPELQGLPENSVYKLDVAKQMMNDDVYPQNGQQPVLDTEARKSVPDAQNTLSTVLTNAAHPNDSSVENNLYSKTMDLAQRNMYRNQLNNALDLGGKTEPGQLSFAVNPDTGAMATQRPDMNAQQLYLRLFGNSPSIQQPNINKFLAMVKKGGGDDVQASKVIDALNKVRNTPISSIARSAASSMGLRGELAASDPIGSVIEGMFTSDNARQLIHLLTGNNPGDTQQVIDAMKLLQSTNNKSVMAYATAKAVQAMKGVQGVVNVPTIGAQVAAPAVRGVGSLAGTLGNTLYNALPSGSTQQDNNGMIPQ